MKNIIILTLFFVMFSTLSFTLFPDQRDPWQIFYGYMSGVIASILVYRCLFNK